MGTKIYVKNVPLAITEWEIKSVFGAAGSITGLTRQINKVTDLPIEDVIIEYSDDTPAIKAYFDFNGDYFGAKPLKIGFLESGLREGAERGLLNGFFRSANIRHFNK